MSVVDIDTIVQKITSKIEGSGYSFIYALFVLISILSCASYGIY